MPYVRYTVYTATFKGPLSAQHVCSHCGHVWDAIFDVSISKSEYSRFWARYNANKALERQKRRLRNEKVTCPICNHFSTAAMANHFPQGLAEGILGKYRSTRCKFLVGCSIVCPIFLFIGRSVFSPDVAVFWRIVAGLLGMIGLLGVLVTIPLLFVSPLTYPKLAREIRGSNADHLLAICLRCYEKNKGSLMGDAWDDVPAFHKDLASGAKRPSASASRDGAIGASQSEELHKVKQSAPLGGESVGKAGQSPRAEACNIGEGVAKMQTTCPACRARLRVGEAQIGRKGRCPKCGSQFMISR